MNHHATKNLWTRDELILASNLYLKLPFGKLHSGTPQIIHLANLLGRTPGSISMRLNNFASVDPGLQQRGIKGLAGGRSQVEPIWNEFILHREELLFESERILAKLEHTSIENKFFETLKGTEHLKREYRIKAVKARVKQTVFRQIVLANYSGKCAITGIDIPDLLLASHIIPWSANESERLNPENGICLSPLYDRAFDKGYISINKKYEILLFSLVKKTYKEDYYLRYFGPVEGTKIILPTKYYPMKEFLQFIWKKCLSADRVGKSNRTNSF